MHAISLNHVGGDEAARRFHLATPRDLFKQRSPTINEGNVKEKMEEIRNYVHNTMEIYEKVFDCLASEEAFYVQPIHKLRHPMIFYYGHTASFYINKLCVAGLVPRINPAFEKMFAIGVDEMSWDDLNEKHYAWPSVQEVRDYRLRVREVLDEMMTSGAYTLRLPLTLANSTADDASAFWWVMLMSAEHERIHVETASVHVRELPLSYVRPEMAAFWQCCPHKDAWSPTNELVAIEGGEVQVGRRPNSALYGWDCDYSTSDPVRVAPFKASKFLVSNAEFFGFMKAGGYSKAAWWDAEGWSWVQWRKPEHPWFWVRDESRPDGYALRLQVDLIDLPWNWPCELNNLEAHAFCQYKSEQLGRPLRMPTEAEWTLLYDRYIGKDMPSWGKAAPGNINLETYRSSCPVNEHAHGDLYDVVGNVWQHCATPVYPYEGFQVHPFYDDFSLPTFDGRHTSMKGGAWISTGNEATRDARFAFRRHFFQFIGLRYVEGPAEAVPAVATTGRGLGLDPEVDAITDANYRASFGGIPNGSAAIAEFAHAAFVQYASIKAGRALDITCGAGRVTYELTQHFSEVVGVDYTARRLMPAYALLERGECQYSVPARLGMPREQRTVRGDDYAWGPFRERATFYQSDATNLHAHLDGFSMIVCWNCLERSYKPSAIPAHLLSRLLPGGILVMGGDYAWKNIEQNRNTTATTTTAATAPSSKRRHSQSDNTYATDPLVSATTANMQEEIFTLLGGDRAVRRCGEPKSIAVAFPSHDNVAEVRIVTFSVYQKK